MNKHLAEALMAKQPRLLAASAFLVLYAARPVVFAVMPHAGDPAWGTLPSATAAAAGKAALNGVAKA